MQEAWQGSAWAALSSAALLTAPWSGVAAQALEEVVVTARKKEESLQDVPISISAFSAQDLRDRNIDNAYDLAEFTPNFTFNRNIVGRRLDAPTIRGQFSPLLGQSNSSFFIDGVFVSGTAGNLSIDNLDRIEVLRGPQAAQFGRATFAGAVNFITRQPTNEFEGEINVRAGEDEDYKLGAWASGPILEDSLRYFVSGSWESYGGEWNNEIDPASVTWDRFGTWPDGPPASAARPDGRDLGGESVWDFTGKLVWDATDDLELSAKIQYTETDDDHYIGLPSFELNCFRNQPAGPGLWEPVDPLQDAGVRTDMRSPGWFCGELDFDNSFAQMNLNELDEGATTRFGSASPAQFVGIESETWRYLGEAVYDLNDWELVGRATYNDQELIQFRDLDRTPALGPVYANLFTGGEDTRFEDWSVELRFNSPTDLPIRGQGGYFHYESEKLGFQRDFTGVCRFDWERYEKAETENVAFFGGIEWDIRQDLTFAYETRYAKDTPRQFAENGVNAETNYYSFTPRYTLTWRPNDDMSVYGQIAKGNKPGGFFFAFFDFDVAREETIRNLDPETGANPNPQPGDPAGDVILDPDLDDALRKPTGVAYAADEASNDASIKEEEAWTYEIGFKSLLMDGRLLFNAAAFYIDWENQGINETVEILTSCDDEFGNPINLVEPNSVVLNAGKSRVYGVEIETSYAVNENLVLSATYGLQDTKLEDFNSLTYADLTGISDPDFVDGGNVSGNEAPRTPRETFTLSADYRRGLTTNLGWFARTDYAYQDKQWVTAANRAYYGSTQLWNARAGLEAENWTVSIYVDNILDEDAATMVSDFPNFDPFPPPGNVFDTTFVAVPRRGTNWGVTGQYRF